MTSYDNLLVRAQDLVNVEVAVLVSPSLIVLMVSVDVKQHSKKNNLLHTERHIEDFCSTCGTHPPDMLCLSVWNKCLKCHVYGLVKLPLRASSNWKNLEPAIEISQPGKG